MLSGCCRGRASLAADSCPCVLEAVNRATSNSWLRVRSGRVCLRPGSYRIGT
jgi:hypothetical protein